MEEDLLQQLVKMVGKNNEIMQDVLTKVDNLDTKVNRLDAKVDHLTTEIVELKGRVSGLENRFDKLEDHMLALSILSFDNRLIMDYGRSTALTLKLALFLCFLTWIIMDIIKNLKKLIAD